MLFLSCIQLYVERLAKAVRKKRADAEKAAAEAHHGMGAKQAAAQGDSTSSNSSDMFLGAVSSVADSLGSFELGLPCFTTTVGDTWQSLQIINTVWDVALV